MLRITSRERGRVLVLLTALSFSLQPAQALPEDSPEISLMSEEEFNTVATTHTPSIPDSSLADEASRATAESYISERPTIRNIIILGTTLKAAILSKLPASYKPGSIFKPTKSGDLIRAIYSLGYFLPAISLKARAISPTEIDLYISVQEKSKIEDVQFEGTSAVKKEELEKELHTADIRAATEEDLEHYAQEIKRFYATKDYHKASVRGELQPTQEGRSRACFYIDEGPRAVVKRVFFEGNKSIPSKLLRSLIYTREEWLFSFFDKSGSYQPDAIEMDKRIIEQFYQSNGFLTARVLDAAIEMDPDGCYANVTFCIDEGELYYVKKVAAPGNDILSEAQILSYAGIRPGELYSRERITDALKKLRLLWGEYGYIYADIDPLIQPNEEEKSVDITFITELGPKVTVRRINIVGNEKTRDTVVLRELTFNEGELLTTQKMDEAKRRIEGLGFFEQKDGVEWKINRIAEEQVDLDLLVKETRTGRGYAQVGYGGMDQDLQSPSATFNVSAGIQDTNFRGTGVSYNLTATYSRQDIGFNIGLANPRLFDRPIGVGVDFFHRHSNYDEYKNVTNTPKERITGGLFTANFIPQWLWGSRFIFDVGAEHIGYKNDIEARVPTSQKQFAREFEQLTRRRFQPGTLVWLGATLIQDYRNHPMFPSKGYQWALYSKLGIPHGSDTFGFFKWEGDAHWYTPLIDDYNLILHLHGHVGIIAPISGHTIPYRELFHIGGPASVRGYVFGQIGPSVLGDSIGATKAFFINTELLFPITRDLSIRGVLFYDGGAGWDTPDATQINQRLLKNNRFNYRHAIGFGVRLTNPAPIRIEIGFKLDRNRKRGESISEVYFNTAAEF